MEAELDYFGGHMYDLKSAESGEPVKGRHHFEWKSAKEIFEDFKEKP
jgi:6-phosphogluconate dehydrogenase